MDGRQRRGLIIGGIAAIVILAVLFVVVGADRVIETLLAADPALVAATFGLALCWLIAWSLMLRTVLGSLDVDLSVTTSFLVYSGAVFANNVTPFGQAGGEPVAAALISQASGSRYETGLVGIASVDVLNVVPSISIVFLGVGYYATTAAIGERLEVAVTVAVALIAAIVTAIGLGWRYRRVVVDRLPSAVGGLAGRLDRFDAATVEAGSPIDCRTSSKTSSASERAPGGWPPRSASRFPAGCSRRPHSRSRSPPSVTRWHRWSRFSPSRWRTSRARPPSPAGSAESRRRSWRCSSRRPVFRHRRSPLPCSCSAAASTGCRWRSAACRRRCSASGRSGSGDRSQQRHFYLGSRYLRRYTWVTTLSARWKPESGSTR